MLTAPESRQEDGREGVAEFLVDSPYPTRCKRLGRQTGVDPIVRTAGRGDHGEQTGGFSFSHSSEQPGRSVELHAFLLKTHGIGLMMRNVGTSG